MRERADDIGARLTLWSHAPTGTGVELAIPNGIAYRPVSARPRAPGWFHRLTRRRSTGAGDR